MKFLFDYRFALSGENSHLNNTNKGNNLLRLHHIIPVFLKGLRNASEYTCVAVPT